MPSCLSCIDFVGLWVKKNAMRQIIFVFLLLVGVVQPVHAQNRTQVMQSLALASIHIASGFLPDTDAVSGAKFGVQFATGIQDPVLAAATLGVQHVYLGDKTALGSSFSMANRAIAKNFAGYYNTTETSGYVAAVIADAAALFVIDHFMMAHWDLRNARKSIEDWTLPGAAVNACNQFILEQGYASEMAGLLTSVVTGAVAVMVTNEQYRTTLVAECAFRLLPSMAQMISPEMVDPNIIPYVGTSLIVLSNRMQQGHLKMFTVMTGISFLISVVADLVGQLHRNMDKV